MVNRGALMTLPALSVPSVPTVPWQFVTNLLHDAHQDQRSAPELGFYSIGNQPLLVHELASSPEMHALPKQFLHGSIEQRVAKIRTLTLLLVSLSFGPGQLHTTNGALYDLFDRGIIKAETRIVLIYDFSQDYEHRVAAIDALLLSQRFFYVMQMAIGTGRADCTVVNDKWGRYQVIPCYGNTVPFFPRANWYLRHSAVTLFLVDQYDEELVQFYLPTIPNYALWRSVVKRHGGTTELIYRQCTDRSCFEQPIMGSVCINTVGSTVFNPATMLAIPDALNPYVLFVPRGERLTASKVLTHAFHWQVWLVVLAVAFGCMALSRCLPQMFQGNFFWVVFFDYGVHRRGLLSKFVAMGSRVLLLFVSYAYESKLTSMLMTGAYESDIRTVQQFLDSKHTLMVSNSLSVQLENFTDLSEAVISQGGLFETVQFTGHHGYLIDHRQAVRLYYSDSNQEPVTGRTMYTIVPELFTQQMNFFHVADKLPIAAFYRDTLERLLAAGLYQYWAKVDQSVHARDMSVYSVQSAVTVNLGALWPAWFVLLCGWTVSSIMGGMEVFSEKQRRRLLTNNGASGHGVL